MGGSPDEVFGCGARLGGGVGVAVGVGGLGLWFLLGLLLVVSLLCRVVLGEGIVDVGLVESGGFWVLGEVDGNQKLLGLSIDITDIDTTLVCEEDPVAL